MIRLVSVFALGAACAALVGGCGDGEVHPQGTAVEGACELSLPEDAEPPEFLRHIGCTADFTALASLPLDVTLPGARSVKVVLDQDDGLALYFQNSRRYRLHYEFASTHLSGGSLPTVGSLSDFNASEYYTPGRRFILGSVTYYDGPKAWVLELAPYDTASSRMIALLYDRVKAVGFFGAALAFHPTSEALAEAATNSSALPVKTTEQLYAATDFQPLALGTSIGWLRFDSVATLQTDTLSPRDVLVLDSAPNDVPVVAGLVSADFQTPLSNLNVLAQSRRTPNMGLREALTNGALRALEGKLVQLLVSTSTWSVREVSQSDAQTFWDAHGQSPIALPALNPTITALTEIEDVTPEPASRASLRDALEQATSAFGSKAAHYSILSRTADVSVAKAFAIPVHYYDAFMRENGFFDAVHGLLADPEFTGDPVVRAQELAELREAMLDAPLEADFVNALRAELAAGYAGASVLFRASTNGEDLEGFACAGCYDSYPADPADTDDVLDAIRRTYASAWKFRTFEERSYYGIDHESLGIGLLVQRAFSHGASNGVALTANPFDAAGVDPAFYVNAQRGDDAQIVSPPIGVTGDQFLYYFGAPNQPISYLARSNRIAPGDTVLSRLEAFQLGLALAAVQSRFSPAYGPAAGNRGVYGLDVEFEFDSTSALYVKQARPHPGPSSSALGG